MAAKRGKGQSKIHGPRRQRNRDLSTPSTQVYERETTKCEIGHESPEILQQIIPVVETVERARGTTLYMVATPLGNLRDITLRALDILASVDVIVCESLNRAKKLLRAYRIQPAQLLVCQAGNEEASATGLIKLMQRGTSIAYICDAGTPGLNDPGMRLVAAARSEGFAVEALPGPSALTMIASLASASCKPLSFIGFLSPKSRRRRRELKFWLEQGHSFVFYESPFRIISTLEELAQLAPEREIGMGREMTKKNAQFLWGTSDYILCQLNSMSTVCGEFTLLVAAG